MSSQTIDASPRAAANPPTAARRRHLARTLLLVACALWIPPSLYGQAIAHRAAFVEILGNGGLYSLNYEQSIRDRVVGRIGVGAWKSEGLFFDGTTRIVSVPMTVSVLRGGPLHSLEMGVGLVAGHRSDDAGSSGAFLTATGIIGYRFQKPGGFLFRAGFTPLLGITGGDAAYPDEGFTPSAGVSFGRSWR